MQKMFVAREVEIFSKRTFEFFLASRDAEEMRPEEAAQKVHQAMNNCRWANEKEKVFRKNRARECGHGPVLGLFLSLNGCGETIITCSKK